MNVARLRKILERLPGDMEVRIFRDGEEEVATVVDTAKSPRPILFIADQSIKPYSDESSILFDEHDDCILTAAE